MSKPKTTPAQVDELRVSIVMDNTYDALMSGTVVAKRFPLRPSAFEDTLPIAEHGFSALIEARLGDKNAVILFDTGVSRTGVLHNMDAMEIKLSDIQAIVLSHGHTDHTTGLYGIVTRRGAGRIPLVLHPDAYLERKIVMPSGNEVRLPPPKISDLRQENVEVIEETHPSMLIDDMILISGEIDRGTDFEKGLPSHFAKKGQSWKSDPLIMDDQCAIIYVKDKGLVIVTGCGHSGIINVIRNAKRLTGIENIYCVIGGFHLTGGHFEKIIPDTIAALSEIKPSYLMPGHCTGWTAINKIAASLPDAFIPSNVGTTLVLKSDS